MVSRWYTWFVDLGYPELDIQEHWSWHAVPERAGGGMVYAPDGSWSIIKYLNSPIIPSLTRWQLVLGVMENVGITTGFVEKYVKQLDTSRKEFWDREEAKTRAVEEEHARVERHQTEFVDRAHGAITKNPDLMERIAKNGLQEMDLSKIRRNIPNYKM